MSYTYNYKVFPNKIAIPTEEITAIKYEGKIMAIFILFICGIILFGTGELFGWIFGVLAFTGIIFVISKIADDVSKNKLKIEYAKTKRSLAYEMQRQADAEADLYSKKLNDLLSKTHQIVYEILPSYDNLAKQYLEIAKNDFEDRAYSPFWSNIEEASNSLAYFKEAVIQLCTNSELYTQTLKKLNHNFPIPFPFSTKISVSRTLEDYRSIIRQAHTDPTFSIIWEQRRNTEILVGGFRNLENAIANMSSDISNVISDLSSLFSDNFRELRYLQQHQVETIRECESTLNQTLTAMDSKLYYIQWKRKPLGNFKHR
jgi:hypothetical protein